MFYNKYRPQTFSEISKPNDTAVALMNQVASGKVGHAYLFHGPRGTGKTTAARILAKALNCTKVTKAGDPCGKCDNCLAIQGGNFADLIEIDAASNRGIDDIRDLRDKLKLSPSLGKKKIYIIDEVHMLTNEAFNALLKTLEEPPVHAVFILATTEFHKVPDTIKSRCQVYKFKRATTNQLVERLEFICKEEKVELPKEDLKMIAEASVGGFRDANTLLQQVVEGSISVEALVSVGSIKSHAEFFSYLVNNDRPEALHLVNKIYEEGSDLYFWTGEFLKYSRDIILVKSGASELLSDSSVEYLGDIKELAENTPIKKVTQIIEAFIKAQNSIRGSFITQLPLELAITYVTDTGDDVLVDTPSPKPVITRTIKTKSKKSLDSPDESGNVEFSVETEEETVVTVEDKANTSGDEDTEIYETETELNDISQITQKWSMILSEVAGKNSSIQALLKSSTPVLIQEGYLVLEVFYAFHKERLESPRNRKLIESILKDTFGGNLRLKCVLSENRPALRSEKETGELTDYNVVMPANNEGSPLELFDGALPLG